MKTKRIAHKAQNRSKIISIIILNSSTITYAPLDVQNSLAHFLDQKPTI